MKKILLVAVLALGLALAAGHASSAAAATGQSTVPVPGGTLYYDLAGNSHFDYSAPVPDGWAAGSTWDAVTADWWNVTVRDLVCVDLYFTLPSETGAQGPKVGDYGWQCATVDNPITSNVMSDVSLNSLAHDFDLSSPGMIDRPGENTVYFGGTDSLPSTYSTLPNLDQYVGTTLDGWFRVQSQSFAYYSPIGPENMVTGVGYSGTITSVSGMSRSLSSAGGPPAEPKWGAVKVPVSIKPTASDCRVPALHGRTLHRAKGILRAAHCRVGKVTRVHSRPALRGRVLRVVTHGRKWFGRNAHLHLVVGS